MLELKRTYDSNGKEKFIIKTDEGTFKIFYGADLCLYWSCNIINQQETDNKYTYTITDENKYVYRIFNELYDSVVSKTPFKHFKSDQPEKFIQYNDNNLVKDDLIEWHSDDILYDAASYVQIEKDAENNRFVITFNKSKVLCDDVSPFSTFTVMFSVGECRYAPYNAAFIDMHRKLAEYCDRRGYTFSKASGFKKKRVRIR